MVQVVNSTIKKINLITKWNVVGDPRDQDQTNDACKLCKRPLVAPTLQELQIVDNKNIILEGKLAKGKCGDIFHEKCIINSLNSGCNSCPTCNIPWQQIKQLNSNIICGSVEKLTVKKKTNKVNN